jgi:hypothetical protein
MFQVNVFQFYRLGYRVNRLTRFDPDATVNDIAFDLQVARKDVERVLQETIFHLPTVEREGNSLLKAIDRVLPPGIPPSDLGKKVKPLILQRMVNTVRRFETVLDNELARADIYSVSQKAIYDTSLLIEHAELILSESVRAVLPDQARDDLRQAGRCLAFETPTAAGFHLFRAAESVIKKYYEKLAKHAWPHNQRDWGKYIVELRKLSAPDKITTALDQTKANYRNPLIHPEDNLDLDEALSLFGMVQGVVTLMLQEILVLN